MNDNEIILLVIIIAIAIILVIAIYFGFIYAKSKITKKKVDSIFDPERLIEEESLMNSMDEKINVDFSNSGKDNFVNDTVKVDMVKTDSPTDNEQINPFGVDLTKTTQYGKDYIKEEEKRTQNKFFN